MSRGGLSALEWYRGALVGLLIAFVYTNVHRYLFVAGVSPLQPSLVVAALAGPSFLLVAQPAHLRQVLRSPLAGWALLYSLVTGVSYFASSASVVALGSVARAWLSVALILSFLALFADAGALRQGRRLVVYATLAAVGTNVVDVIRPETFSVIFGRSAGLYLNPNISGSAIVFGMVLGMGVLRPSYRMPFAAIAGAGVLATLSRSGILCWFLVSMVFLTRGSFRHVGRWGTASFVAAGLVAIWLPAQLLGDILLVVEALGGGKMSRLSFGPEVLNSTSIVARGETIRESLELLQVHPIIGSGTGATREWRLSESTHNIYLKFLVEHGILGPVLYLLSLSFLLRIAPQHRTTSLAFAGAWLWYGLFTHNDLETPHSLLALSMTASLTDPGGGEEPLYEG